MEELITYLSQYMPITIAYIIVIACMVLFLIIKDKVKRSGLTLNTIVKESTPTLKNIAETNAFDMKLLVDSTAKDFQALVNERTDKLNKDYKSAQEENEELKKRIINNDKALAEIISITGQVLGTMQLLVTQNALIAQANKISSEETITNPDVAARLKGIYNAVIGNEKTSAEMYSAMRKLEKIALAGADISSVVAEVAADVATDIESANS